MKKHSFIRCIFPIHRFWRVLGGVLLLAHVSLAHANHGREVRVGVYSNEPKIFLGQDGQPSGILGDLLAEIARQEGWTLRPVACEWQACMDALASGAIDLLPDMAFSEERQKRFDFHRQPVLHSWSQLYRHDAVKLDSMLDLQGKRVGVLAGSIQAGYLAELLPNFGIQAKLVPVKSMQEGFNKVVAHELDAVVTNRFTGELQAPRFQLRATPVIFQPAQVYYAVQQGRNADLLAAMDRHLVPWQAQQDSMYFRVLEHWMGPPPPRGIPVMLGWGLAILTALLLLTVAGMALLRRQVAEKTRQLRDNEDRLNTILDSVEAFIYIKGKDFRYQYANRKVCDLFGRPNTEVTGHDDSEFFDAATAANLRNNDLRVLEYGERVEVEEINRGHHDGEARTFLSVKLPLRHADGKIYALCGVSTDITRQKKAEEAIHQLAFYDSLTQLPNRRLLQDRLEQAVAACSRRPQGGALLFIDLDNFKDLNDTLGHDMGDQLLVQVARRLRACTREVDTLARLGGDEFVVMLQGLSPNLTEALQQAEHVGQKVQTVLSQPYALAGLLRQSTVSIGIAMFSDSHNTKEDLLKRADLAMYQAKADGRNTLRFFNPAMQAQVSARAAIEADLRDALTQLQFVLHYQPQVDSVGQVIGVESLVRWQHPEHGLVLPNHFIPAAESSGLIQPLGDWILHTACMQLVAWAGNPLTAQWFIAVNVSAYQFRHPEFADKVFAILAQTGARPEYLKLELTESQLIDDLESVIAKMLQLRGRGVRFSLDDFGTGYSSLSFLKRLPLDQLKIDRSFVRDLLTDPDDAAIVKAIVTLGQSLGLNVIAEGVETQEQRMALEQIGCHYFQGYLFGRPVPADTL